MNEMILEKEKNFDNDNSISKLKDSIKSNIIKNMLIAEDLKYKNKQDIQNKLKPKINQGISKHSKNTKINKNKKEIIKKESINEINNAIIIQKIKPKSKTINNLINQNKNKNDIKSIHKKIIKEKEISKNNSINKKLSNSYKKLGNNKNPFQKNINIKNKYNSKSKSKNQNKNIQLGKDRSKSVIKSFSPKISRNNNILKDPKTCVEEKCLYNSDEKIQSERIKSKILIEDKEILGYNKQFFLIPKFKNKIKEPKIQKKEKINKKKSILDEINENINIINKNNTFNEKRIQDFSSFLEYENNLEERESPKIKNALNIFKKGNKYIKNYIHLPIYHKYSNNEIIKDIIFSDIMSFLLPYERYIFAKTNKETLIKYMKIKGQETEELLDKYNLKKEKLEKLLNKNRNIKITKNNFFNNKKLLQIIELLNNEIYLEIFNNKAETPNDNIIFVYKLFFLLIKNTDKLIQLNNKVFWEKICEYFINNTNEFNDNDLLLGDLIKKLMIQKMNFSDENLKKIYEIVNQIDIRQIQPVTFSKISPTTSQFCYIIEYFLEFFGIFESEESPLENEYIMIQYKIKKLIKRINKIGLYIVNLKYKDKNKFS